MTKIVIQKTCLDYPYYVKGIFIFDDCHKAEFEIKRDDGNYVFYLLQGNRKWHFKNVDGYPPSVSFFNHIDKLIKWAGEHGLKLFDYIKSGEDNEKRRNYSFIG